MNCEVAIIYEKYKIIHHIRKKIKTKTKMISSCITSKSRERERERERDTRTCKDEMGLNIR